MAASSLPPIPVSLSKPVQGLVINGEQVPEKYIYRRTEYGPIGASFPVMEIPVVDLSLLTSSLPTEEEAELDKLRSALSSWDSFQAVNHGMADSFCRPTAASNQEILCTSDGRKAEILEIPGKTIKGDTVFTENQTLDWTDYGLKTLKF